MKSAIQTLLNWDNRWTHRLRMPPGKNARWYLMSISAHSGDPWYWLIGFSLAALLTNDGWQEQAIIFVVSIFFLGILTTTLKYLFRRSRPVGSWGDIYRRVDPHSFPSGHAARSAMLVVLGFGLGPSWLAGSLLLHAPFVIISRVATGVHYLSDVIAGAALGTLFGFFMLTIKPLILLYFLPLFQTIARTIF